jgi:hypothetical protein
MTSHPLEDEDIIVTVAVMHVPTRKAWSARRTAPADGGLDVSEAAQQALQEAMDKLLAALEQQGG